MLTSLGVARETKNALPDCDEPDMSYRGWDYIFNSRTLANIWVYRDTLPDGNYLEGVLWLSFSFAFFTQVGSSNE